MKQGNNVPYKRPVLVKQVSQALPLNTVCQTRKVPTHSRTKESSSPVLEAEAGREVSCRLTLCPLTGVPRAAVKDFPSFPFFPSLSATAPRVSCSWGHWAPQPSCPTQNALLMMGRAGHRH